MKYISRPHEIKAFQFLRGAKAPDWFVDAYHLGKIQMTLDEEKDDDNYIVVFGKQQTEKAFLTDWVCRADHGKIYVLDDASFRESYVLKKLTAVPE